MPLNDIIITKGEGGLGRPLPGEDHICGLQWYAATLPTGYGANDRIKQYFSLSEAEADGIVEGDANWGVLWYHISEFFRGNPKGILWTQISVAPVDPAPYDFAEIVTLQLAADGKIRQCGVFILSVALAAAHFTALQLVATQLFNEHQPMSFILSGDISATADITTIFDIRALDVPNVSGVIGQDGAAAGKALFTSTGKSVSCLGYALGVLSVAKVNESIAWVGKFPLSNGTELNVAAFANGQLVKALSTAALNALNDKGWIFLRKHVGISNTYFNDSHTGAAANSDYAYIENVRTIDKACRNVRTVLLPQLNGPVLLDPASGRLSEDYIEFLKALGDTALAQMERDGELSGYQTIINPEQDVNASGAVEVSIENVAVGVSRKFNIKIGYVKSLS